MTCEDDSRVKFWDVRKANECLKVLSDHSHWLVSEDSSLDRLKRIECSSRNR